MKKDRNTFFSESNMFQSNYPQMQPAPMMQPVPMQQPMQYQQVPLQQPIPPYQQSTASNSFYVGPQPNQMTGTQTGTTGYSDMESRLAKMERQIRRLETRVNKLESNYGMSGPIIKEEIDTNYSSGMYMI